MCTGGLLEWHLSSNNCSAWWFENGVGSVLHHTGVTLSCVKLREEMFILIDSRFQFMWKHQCGVCIFKWATVEYLKHAEQAPLTDIQVVGRFSEVILIDNVKGWRSAVTWYLCLFHFLWGEAPVPPAFSSQAKRRLMRPRGRSSHSSDTETSVQILHIPSSVRP